MCVSVPKYFKKDQNGHLFSSVVVLSYGQLAFVMYTEGIVQRFSGKPSEGSPT